MKEFVEYLVKNLVDSPESVQVECKESESGMIVELRVANGDIGKVVGKNGRTINALRTLSMMVSARLGQRVRINLLDD